MHRTSLNAGLVGLISRCLLPHRREREERRKEIREAANQFMAGAVLVVITFFFPKLLEILIATVSS